MNKNTLYKIQRIRKLASQIRTSEASDHSMQCQCAVCQTDLFIRRSMLFLEKSLAADEAIKS